MSHDSAGCTFRPTDVIATLLRLFRHLHNQVRAELFDLDTEGLNWIPVTGANTIAVIVSHLVGSEAETLRCVAELPCGRDRDAEFSSVTADMAGVMAMLDAADVLVADVEPLIHASRLQAMLSLPTLPSDAQQSGLTWLVRNYGHACEHVGHIQMTAQLHRARP